MLSVGIHFYDRFLVHQVLNRLISRATAYPFICKSLLIYQKYSFRCNADCTLCYGMFKPLNCQYKFIPKSSLQFFAEDKNECRQDQLKSANDLDDICRADKASKPKKRRVTNEDVLQMQYDCLNLQRENLNKGKKTYTTSAIVRAASASTNLHLIIRDCCFVGAIKAMESKVHLTH